MPIKKRVRKPRRMGKYKRRAFKKYSLTNLAMLTNASSSFAKLNAMRPQIYRFTRASLNNNLFTQAGGSGVAFYSGVINFALNTVPAITEFQNLFCKYRVTKCKLCIRFEDLPTAGIIQPTLYLWKNYDTAAGSFTGAQLAQINNIRRIQLSNEHREIEHTIVPYCLPNIFSGGYIQQRSSKTWIDINYPGIQHYGYGYAIDNLVGSGVTVITASFDLELTLEFMDQF